MADTKSPEEVFALILGIMNYDNNVVFLTEPKHAQRAVPYIETMQRLGFFKDDPESMEGSFWQMGAGEETERREFFKIASVSFAGLDAILNDIFDGPVQPAVKVEVA